MAAPNKLAKLGVKGVLEALNDTGTIREAAERLKVSPQTLYHFMPGRIARHCVYIAIGTDRTFTGTVSTKAVVDSEGQAQ